MQLNSQSCETKSDVTFLTLSLLGVLFSEIEMVGYLADDDFYQRFAEADSSLLEYISRSLTKVETISDDRGIFSSKIFLIYTPGGDGKRFINFLCLLSHFQLSIGKYFLG